MMAQAARLQARQRYFNLVVTNVPGPAVPALRARAPHARDLPDGAARAEPRARDRDHELRRHARSSGSTPTSTRCPTSSCSPRSSPKRSTSWPSPPGCRRAAAGGPRARDRAAGAPTTAARRPRRAPRPDAPSGRRGIVHGDSHGVLHPLSGDRRTSSAPDRPGAADARRRARRLRARPAVLRGRDNCRCRRPRAAARPGQVVTDQRRAQTPAPIRSDRDGTA